MFIANCTTGRERETVSCRLTMHKKANVKIINPYYNFFKSYQIDETCFVSGAHDAPDLVYVPDQNGEYAIDMANNEFMNVVDYVNCFSNYFRYLRGMLYVSKENFLKVKGYNELIDTYGFEDGDMETKLKNIGLTHKKISYDHTLIHIPHSDKKRIENCKYNLSDEKEIRSKVEQYFNIDIEPYKAIIKTTIKNFVRELKDKVKELKESLLQEIMLVKRCKNVEVLSKTI